MKHSNVTIYLTEEQLSRIDAIKQELSRRAGVKVSRSAAAARAIDDFFLAICHINMTNGQNSSQSNKEHL